MSEHVWLLKGKRILSETPNGIAGLFTVFFERVCITFMKLFIHLCCFIWPKRFWTSSFCLYLNVCDLFQSMLFSHYLVPFSKKDENRPSQRLFIFFYWWCPSELLVREFETCPFIFSPGNATAAIR